MFGNKADLFLEFREKAFTLSEEEYANYYKNTDDCNLIKGSDLNSECLQRIPSEVKGLSVLDVGCGRGLLVNILSRKYKATGVDISISNSLSISNEFSFVEANVENLPFSDNAFDTIICTHVLEHVRNFNLALSELRRVAKKRIIIVIPKERPYKFGFNLHLSFFPYKYSLEQAFMAGQENINATISLEGGDWMYIEDLCN